MISTPTQTEAKRSEASDLFGQKALFWDLNYSDI